MRSLCLGRVWPTARRSLFGILFVFVFFLLPGTEMAAAEWSPSATVSESGTRYGFGQDVAPDGTGMVVWSAPLAGGAGYSINARDIGADGQLGTEVAVSEAAPGAAYTSAYAPTVRYDGTGTATVVWLESTYSSNSCFAGSGESGGECVVDEYVKARQIEAGGSLSPVRELQHRQTAFPEEGSFGGTDPAYVTYGEPTVVGGPSDTLTVLWSESTFGSGCAAYGYSRSYSDSECEADQRVKWVRLSAAGVPQAAAQSALESHTSGYGSAEPLLRLRAGVATDGTVTVLFSARRSGGEGECWGGESSIGFFRLGADGEAGPAEELDSGCGTADPDLTLDPGGDAVAVWSWADAYSAGAALFTRIDSAGSASAPQTLLAGEEGARVDGLDVARGVPGSARAVWASEGSIHSRSIPFSGPLGSSTLVAAPPAGRYFSAPRLAAAPDGSAVVVWESRIEGGEPETALQATALDPDGTPHSPRTLLAPNRWDHGPRVSAGPSGSFLVSWRLSVPRRNRIQAARFGGEPAQSNDAFADAQPLEAELPSFASGSNVGASEEPGEPDHAGVAGGASVWFSWTPAESGPVTLSTCASDGLDPALAVYTGGSLATLAPVAAAAAGAPHPCSAGDAAVRFDAVAGTAYRIAVDGEEASQGSFGLKLISRADAPANDAFAAAKQVSGSLPRYISGSNLDASREPGEPEHAGNPGGASVWYSWTASIGGKTWISACGGSLAEPLLGVYTGSDLGSLTEVGGDSAAGCGSVAFEATAGTTYRVAVDGKDGREGKFQLRFVQTPANDALAHAQSLSGLFPSVSGSNVAASKEEGEPDHAGDPGGASVWYSWTPSSDVTAVVTACLSAGKGESALLAIYTGSGYGDLQQVAADAGSGSTAGCFSHKSEARVKFAAGTKYLFAVDGKGGAEGPFSLSVEPVPANDDFAAAQEMTGAPPLSLSGSTSHASKEPGEPDHAGVVGGASVWYAWTAPSSGTATISTCAFFNSSPALAVYTGSDLAHLTEVGSDVGGGTGSCFSPPSEVQFDAEGGTRYYVAVDSPNSTGAFFNLQLELEAAAANDAFASPEDLGSESSAFFQGSNRRASKEEGEPDHAGDPGGASVWFTWTAPKTGTFGISTCSEGSLDPLLALYTGSSLAGLQEVASNDDAGHGPCSEKDAMTRFQAIAGTTYRIAVDGKGGSTGKFSLDLRAAPGNDDFEGATLLESGLPLSRSGSNRYASRQPLEPQHGGVEGGASVWYSWTAPAAGEFELSVCPYGPLKSVLGLYTGSSLGGLTPVSGASAPPSCGGGSGIRFTATAGTTYRFAVDGREGSEGEFDLELRGRPANDDFAAATPIGEALPQWAEGDNRLATKEEGEPDHAGVTGGASVWFTWTAPSDETVAISTCSYGTLDPLLAVYTGSSLAGLQEVAASDDGSRPSCSKHDGEVHFAAKAGTAYRIAVDGKDGTSGPFGLELRPGAGNDAFADAQALPAELPTSIWSSNRVASKEEGEPDHAGDPGGASVWFTWTSPSNGTVKVATCSSHFDQLDPLLAVYTGSSLAGLEAVAANDDTSRTGCSAEDSEVRFAATAGTTYRIAVDGKGGGEGEFQLQLSATGPVNDDFEDAIDIPQAPAVIAGNNAGAGAQPGEGGGAEQTVWYRLVAQRNEQVRLHTCSDGGAPMDLNVFTGTAVGSLVPVSPVAGGTSAGCAFPPGALYGDTPVFAFEAVAGTTYWISVDRYFQISPVFELQPAGPFQLVVDPPANDLRAEAELLPVGSGDFTRSNEGATHEAGEEGHAGDAGGGSVWFDWFATADGPVTVDTCGSAIDTLLAVEDYEGELASSDDSEECGPGALAGSVTFEAEEGELYEFAVDGKGGETGQVQLHVSFEAPDTTPPETHAYIPAAVNTHQLTFSVYRDEPESTFECALDGAPFAPCKVSDPGWSASGTIAGLEEGPHTLAVREVDAAGNQDPTPVSGEFKVDTVPPQTSFASGPEGLTKELGPYGFSSDEAGGFECWIDESFPHYCSSPYSAPEALPDGDHVLHARAVDLAGNVDQTPATRSFHLDRTPPVATVDSGPEGTVESDTVSFEFSADEPATFRCRLDERPEDDCESPRAFAGLTDGDHVFKLTPTDVAGNEGKTATYDFHVENRPPQTKIVTGPPERVATSTAFFEFSADEPVSGFECSLDEAEYVACESPEELSELGEGPHQLLVRAIDTAGKKDPTPEVWSWTVDTTPPETTIAAGPSGTTRNRGPFAFSADELATFQCSLDEAEFEDCDSGYALPFDLPDGEHTLRVRAVDVAGNTDPTPAERTLTLDTTGPGAEIVTPPPVSGPDVVVEFELDEDAIGAECRIDSQSFQPCASPVEFKGMPDGPHTVSVRGVDALGNRGPAASASFTVDAAPPETEINPRQSEYFGPGPVTIGFHGSADAVEYECSLDSAPFAECQSPVVYEGLGEGSHELQVRALDAAGNVDPTPATLSFAVDTTPPETTITAGPSGPIHALKLPFEFESSENPQSFQCALDEGGWRSCPEVLAEHPAGDHLFAVRAVDRAGNVDPTPATQSFTVVNQDPEPTLTLDRVSGPAPLTVSADVGGSDGDGDALSYSLQWGDGGAFGGAAPDAGLGHTYTQPGVYLARAELDDGFGAAAATQVVTVTAPEPVHADAGDDLTVVAGEPVVLDGADSRPLAGVEDYRWTLSDGASSGEERFTHTFAEPGNYEAELTVSGVGGSDNDVALVHVVPPSAEVATVSTRSGGTAIEGVQVVVMLSDGRRVEAVSGNDGLAHLHGLPDGSYKVFANKRGYVSTVGDLDVSGGVGVGSVSLAPGPTAGIVVQSHRMTLEEIEAAGIDTSDPANLHVYEFSVEGSHCYLGSGGFLGCAGGGGGGGGGGCSGSTCHAGQTIGTYYWSPQAKAPIVTFFQLPARATFLKEFYELEATITNFAAPGVTLEHGQAAIRIPTGMSLAPTPTPQSPASTVPDIPGGGSYTLHWILRGDEEGEYRVGVSYAGSLEPFGETISLDGETEEPIKVWGASALKLTVDVDEAARQGYPYTAFVRLKNVADVPVYNPTVELLETGHTGYIEQPRQQHVFGVRELAPGATETGGPFILVPREDGSLDLASSFVRMIGGNTDLGGTVVTHARVPSFDDTPKLEATNLGEQIRLDWEPVPGAQGYQVYRVPDRETPFEEEPVHVDFDGETAGLVPAPSEGEEAYYAVSTIINGRPTMVHPLVKAPPPPPPGEGDEDALGPPKAECPLSRVTLGPAEILSSCFVKKDDNVYEAKSRVRVNGIDLFPQDARVLVDAQQQRIIVNRARLQVGNIVLYEGRIDWSPRATIRLGLPPSTVIRGMPVSGNLAISLQPKRADLEASAKLPSILGGKSGRLKLGATNEDGPKLDLFELEANGLSLDGRLGIDGVLLKYKRTAAGDRWEGGATLAIPRPLSPLLVHGRLAILNGKFLSAAAEVDGINQPLAYGVFLQRLRASVAVDPLSLSGGIGLSAGPQILGHEAISVDGNGTATFGDPHVYEVNGTVKVVEAEIASGYLSYRSSGLVEFGGKLGIDKSGFKAEVSADGWVDGLRAFNAHGTGTFAVSRASFGGEGVVSSVGIAACRRGAGPDVGAGYRWGGDVTFFASSCDIGEFEAVRSRVSGGAGGGLRFQVDPGQPVEVLAFHGSDGPPRVVLHESDGSQVVTPADGQGIDEPQLMLAQSEQDDTTYMAVFSPPGGTWTAATAPGSPAITDVRRAGALPSPQASATVEPRGDEAALHWHLRPIPGQRVQFVERTAHGGQVIATTDDATGTATFTPLADDDASRQIVAVVEQYGLPRTTTAVDRYVAPPAPAPAPQATAGAAVAGDGSAPSSAEPRASRARRPAAPARVRLRRRAGRVVVSWSPVRGAAGYTLRGRLSTGRLVRATPARCRFVIRGVRPDTGVTVSVRALGSDGRRSAPRPARLGALR